MMGGDGGMEGWKDGRVASMITEDTVLLACFACLM